MNAEARLGRPLPLANRHLTEFGCKLLAELLYYFTVGQRLIFIFEHEGITERCNIGFASGSTQLRKHLRCVAIEICAALLGVEINLPESEPPIAAKRVRVFLQVRAQLLVGRLSVGGDVFGDKLELLAQPPPDDRV